ncbi:periplasmic phosphate-binding protein of phosphate ABC transporter [Calothrix sp. NIES-2100]|nr:periplasmic phosphate-binding protein of phosphate ABC transporter [Calothrix sp. NIES-2100]
MLNYALAVGANTRVVRCSLPKTIALPFECSGKRNILNIEASLSGKYPMTHNLFVVVKQTGQTEQQTIFADANLLITQQEQELISQAGFVKIR